ncbi:MAG: hypothetical protein H8E61_01020 [Bacteroidetes bacterium]|nr:hypothetical protein [Bacteroidota bacterium]
MFDSLRKKEYVKGVEEYYGAVPNVPNTQIYRECKKLFCKIPPETAHDLTMNILRKRNNTKVLKEFINKAPDSLSAYALSICSETAKMRALMSNFTSNIGSVIIPKSA